MSGKVEEWAANYEQEFGRKPAELVLRVAEHIEKVGGMLTELGKKDAQEGKEAYSSKDFPTLVTKVFQLDPDKDHETVQAIAELWQSDYMDGYREGGAA